MYTSDLIEKKLKAISGGNAAPVAGLRQLHDVVERSGAANGDRHVAEDPSLKTKPGLY